MRRLRQTFDSVATLGGSLSEFAMAVEAIKAGKAVTLNVTLRMRPEPWEKWHAFRLSGHKEKSARATSAAAQLDVRDKIVDRAVLNIDLTALLGDFIKAFEFTAATSHDED
ncbi:hypothetical protein [Thioclava sp. GXIMD4215]|uniref:hypothetical protein n=1 Tax=Thioclava sp. GXIMD4215 TaxID=3131928 RepID=UPI003250A0D2